MKNIGYLTFLLAASLTIVSCSQDQALDKSSNNLTQTELESADSDVLKEELGEVLSQEEEAQVEKELDEIIINEVVAKESNLKPVSAVKKEKAITKILTDKKVAKKTVKKSVVKKSLQNKDVDKVSNISSKKKAAEKLTAQDTVSTQTSATKKGSGASNTLTAALDPSLAAGNRKGLRGQVTFDGYTDFKETEADDKVYYMQSILNVFYDIGNGDNIGLFVPMQKDLYGEFEEKFFLDSRLAYSQNGIIKNENLMFNMRYGVLYPTTEASKVRDDMTFGLELNPTFIIPLSKLVTGLTAVYIPRYRRRFHKFETNRAGEFLVNESLLSIFVLSYQATDKIDLSTTLLHVASSRYDGVRTDDSYLTAQEIGYRVSPKIRARVGIMTGGNIINRQFGDDDNIEIFDENSTEFYTGFAYQF